MRKQILVLILCAVFISNLFAGCAQTPSASFSGESSSGNSSASSSATERKVVDSFIPYYEGTRILLTPPQISSPENYLIDELNYSDYFGRYAVNENDFYYIKSIGPIGEKEDFLYKYNFATQQETEIVPYDFNIPYSSGKFVIMPNGDRLSFENCQQADGTNAVSLFHLDVSEDQLYVEPVEISNLSSIFYYAILNEEEIAVLVKEKEYAESNQIYSNIYRYQIKTKELDLLVENSFFLNTAPDVLAEEIFYIVGNKENIFAFRAIGPLNEENRMQLERYEIDVYTHDGTLRQTLSGEALLPEFQEESIAEVLCAGSLFFVRDFSSNLFLYQIKDGKFEEIDFKLANDFFYLSDVTHRNDLSLTVADAFSAYGLEAFFDEDVFPYVYIFETNLCGVLYIYNVKTEELFHLKLHDFPKSNGETGVYRAFANARDGTFMLAIRTDDISSEGYVYVYTKEDIINNMKPCKAENN